jgi:hypothetical protein
MWANKSKYGNEQNTVIEQTKCDHHITWRPIINQHNMIMSPKENRLYEQCYPCA